MVLDLLVAHAVHRPVFTTLPSDRRAYVWQRIAPQGFHVIGRRASSTAPVGRALESGENAC